MAAYNLILMVLCTLTCLYGTVSQLNLSVDSSCPASKTLNGTCVPLHRCGSAVLTYLYRNAGFGDALLPTLPEICSNKNNEPVVCCTDCVFTKRDQFMDSAIAPNGILVSRRGPLAWKKCLDYFQRLPYPCRGKGNVALTETLNQDQQCRNVTLRVSVDVGGEETQKWNFPHLALLGYGDSVATAQWLCEGTIISERFILTAAHCSNAGVLGNVAYVALGVKDDSDPHKQSTIYNVKRVISHPNYNEPSWYYDIALLETETEIRFDKDILPACIDVWIHDKSVAVAAGTHNIEMNNTKEEELQTVYQKQYGELECSRYYFRDDNHLSKGFDRMLMSCYQSRSTTDETCKRLAGSPLQIDQFNCQHTVVGVTSRPKPCGKPDMPDFYTRVSYFLIWIEKTVWPEG